MTQDLRPETIAVAAGRPPGEPGDPLSTPVTLTSTYIAGGPLAYARVGNPSWSALEEAIGALEGGTALSFASGLAAVAAVVDDLDVGSLVVAPEDSFTGTRFLLSDAEAHGRIRLRLVDMTDSNATIAACAGAALLWIESPSNPLLRIADIPALAEGARAVGVRVAVDNTFATPLVQRPLDLGADVVVHSATKFLSGHSDVVLGATVTRDETLARRLHDRRSLSGAIPGPVEAFLTLRGLRTLAVRFERASSNASTLAERLRTHATVSRVRYPGFGAIVSFDVHGGVARAEAVCDAVRLITHATSLGGVETTMERRRRHPGEDLAPEELIRVSVGIEHVDDLWADLEQALSR